MARAKRVEAVLPAAPRPKVSRCFRCDGTGFLCDICGEAPDACRCEQDGLGVPSQSACEDCAGTGK